MIPRGSHAPVQLVDVEHAGSQVIDVCGAHAGDVGGHRGDPGQLVVPAAVDRFTRQREHGHRRRQEPVGAFALRTAVGGDASRLGDQRRIEQLPLGNEPLDTVAQIGGEEAGVSRREHRGEHPERVAVQLLYVDRPEGGRHHRHRRRGVAQVVEADRVHAERSEEVGQVGKFSGAAYADRAVTFGGHPLQGAQPIGVRRACRMIAVHAGADLDQGGVRRHLGGVHP